MKEINEDELRFVARHYDENALRVDRAWKGLCLRTGQTDSGLAGVPRRLSVSARRIAASIGIMLIVVGSVACGLWYARRQAVDTDVSIRQSNVVGTSYRYLREEGESIVLKYDNAPIGDVLDELSAYYGRELALQPLGRIQTQSTIGDGQRQEGLRISGEIEAASLEEAIDVLETTLDIKIDIR